MTEEIFIDCTLPLTNIKPFKGHVLVELLPSPTQIGSILLPAMTKARAGAGGALVKEMEKYPAQEGLCRAFGEPDPEHPYEVLPGDRVLVRFYAGKQLNQPPRKFKLLKGTDIEAVFC